MPLFKRPPPKPLTKFKASSPQEMPPTFKPQPEAQALMKPGQSSAEYLQSLEDNKQSMDAVNMMAHGMPERESVWWACQSSQKVSGNLNTADTSALTAAQNWVKNPTPHNQTAAAAAAARTDKTGPGGWAAQAAAWAKPAASPPAASGAPALTGAGTQAPAAAAPEGLAASAVAGSVLLAAGLANGPPMAEANLPSRAAPTSPVPKLATQPTTPAATTIPPVDQDKLAKSLKPFLDLGKDVASGQNTWA